MKEGEDMCISEHPNEFVLIAPKETGNRVAVAQVFYQKVIQTNEAGSIVSSLLHSWN